MKTALDKRLLDLQKRVYISRYSFQISTTVAEQRIGHATVDLTFMPADEFVQLTSSVGSLIWRATRVRLENQLQTRFLARHAAPVPFAPPLPPEAWSWQSRLLQWRGE